jgi:cytochrome c553
MLARDQRRQVFHVEKQDNSLYHDALEAGQVLSRSLWPENNHVNTLMNIRLSAGILLIAATLVATFGAQPAAAQADEDEGRQIGFTCLGCHGIEGQRNAYPSFRVPRLGGQGRDYIATALKAYRVGTRSHPTMHAQASSLSDADIDNLLAWLETSGNARDIATAEQVAGSAAETCIACHGEDSEGVVPQPPILAGQYSDYLVYALEQYKDGARSGNVMAAFAASLTDADIATIADYYAAQDGLETLEQ